MDNSTRLKYLNALIKTIDKVDPSTFSTRVNVSKNDYADWIKKNMADEALARSISSIYDKGKLIEALKQAAQQAPVASSVPVAQPVQVIQSASVTQPATQIPSAPVQTMASVQQAPVQSSVQSAPVNMTFAQIARTPASQISQQVPQQSSQASAFAPQVSAQTPAQTFAQTVQASSNASSSAVDVQRTKYLGALVKTIKTLTDEVFSQRVNAGTNQYADWVMKNMHDQDLYSRLRQTLSKDKMIELLSSEISMASRPKSTLVQMVQSASASAMPQTATQIAPVAASLSAAPVSIASTTLAPTATTVQQAAPVQLSVAPVVKKKVDNVTEIKYLNALIKTIAPLDENTFKQRVNASTNQYADWAMKNIGDERLYSTLRSQSDKDHLIGALRSEISGLSTPQVAVPVAATTAQVVSAPLMMASAQTVIPAQVLAPAPQVTVASTPRVVEVSTVVNEPIIIKTSAPVPEQGTDQKLSAQDLFKKLKQSKEARASGKAAPIMPRLTSVLTKPMTGALSRNYNQDIDLIKMSAREIITKLKIIDYSKNDIAIEEELGVAKRLVKRLKTGVPGFDEMIGAGIPAGSVILASGGPGSGKTTFCIQMLGWAAERGEKCLFISLEETNDRLIEHMESYGLNPKKYIAEGTLMIQQQDPFKISRSIEALLAHGRGELLIDIESIMDIIPKGFTPDRVVIDSLSAIASAFNESNTAYRIYVNQLINLLTKTGATSFLITEVQGIENIGHGLVEEFLADGVIVFYNMQRGNIKQSALEILKMRAVNHDKKIVPFEFVEGKGLVIYPLEKVFI